MPDVTRGTPEGGAADRTMIRLDALTKRYPGQSEAAVDALTLDIPAGHIVTFVGPSGCGKTTTMKLINRLIEPTSGRVHLDGRDVTEVPAPQLRRRIGYTIQQGGLFPHRTVADNIATVPRLLGWDRRRVGERVDELLHLVGLDPKTYRRRYPKQLSGGQQQRVGVARALGGDPQVMLMDEPFGAIDPLNREALQNEFLRIQAAVRKTIVFVTHDMDEAIKMGDRIAIFGDNGRVLQYDTPERILADPAEGFVTEFIGSGASVRRLSLTRLESVVLPDWPTVEETSDGETLRAAARGSDRDYLLVLGDGRRPVGWLPVTGEDRRPGERLPLLSPLGPRDSLFDALDHMLTVNASAAAVVDGDGRYRGVVEMDTLRELINTRAAGAPSSSDHLQEA
ncbi:ATP-binding cassette domain-containing protein [Streptomyces sp. N2-109]|uniref:ATP-binding cassette domain-containing protein n=1 Tax=Streptomyces gossypii TaxID=2883101 RepID=A0ABT2K066_9ACTN|nr:ATP-binding cassette domain-containing protein [Streptomyces gossypii]MCT2593562.1 ATP-binding cassette domain-containing protein [Streptomyces gossypii]